jgi:hypothetical protein
MSRDQSNSLWGRNTCSRNTTRPKQSHTTTIHCVGGNVREAVSEVMTCSTRKSSYMGVGGEGDRVSGEAFRVLGPRNKHFNRFHSVGAGSCACCCAGAFSSEETSLLFGSGGVAVVTTTDARSCCRDCAMACSRASQNVCCDSGLNSSLRLQSRGIPCRCLPTQRTGVCAGLEPRRRGAFLVHVHAAGPRWHQVRTP